MKIRSLQRSLLLVSGGVCVIVGVAGTLLWRDLRERTEALVLRQTPRDDDGDSAATVTVTVKRVLVRRRVDAAPDDLGEVLEEQLLGTFEERAGEARPTVAQMAKKSLDAKEMAKQLSMPQKIGIFGSLVALFVGFNLWAIPKLRRGMTATDAPRLVHLPQQMIDLVQRRGFFVDMACGDGSRLVEAARVFDAVHGYEKHGVTSWRTKKLLASEPKIHVQHLRNMNVAADSLSRADLVFCNSASLAEQVWPLVKAGGFLCTEDELSNLPAAVWKGEDMQLYKKD